MCIVLDGPVMADSRPKGVAALPLLTPPSSPHPSLPPSHPPAPPGHRIRDQPGHHQ